MGYPSRVRDDEPGCGRNRPVNSEGSANQRFREFWTEISGCGGNRGGSCRTLFAISRNGEHWPASGIAANRCDQRPETRNARLPISRGRALTGVRAETAENQKAPWAGQEYESWMRSKSC